jgi:hypothetical protein
MGNVPSGRHRRGGTLWDILGHLRRRPIGVGIGMG